MVSGRDILEALQGIERDLRNIDRRLASVERAVTHTSTRLGHVADSQLLDGRRISAMRIESAATLSRIEAATRALHKSADEAADAAQKIEKTGKEITGSFKTMPAEEFDRIEITSKGLRFSATWLKLGGAVKAIPLVVKAFALLAALAGAAWAWFAHQAHRL